MLLLWTVLWFEGDEELFLLAELWLACDQKFEDAFHISIWKRIGTRSKEKRQRFHALVRSLRVLCFVYSAIHFVDIQFCKGHWVVGWWVSSVEHRLKAAQLSLNRHILILVCGFVRCKRRSYLSVVLDASTYPFCKLQLLMNSCTNLQPLRLWQICFDHKVRPSMCDSTSTTKASSASSIIVSMNDEDDYLSDNSSCDSRMEKEMDAANMLSSLRMVST